jgi:hypothetical protein
MMRSQLPKIGRKRHQQLCQREQVILFRAPKRVAAVLLAVMKLVSTASQTTGDRTTDWLEDTSNLIGNPYPSAIDANMFWPQTQPV